MLKSLIIDDEESARDIMAHLLSRHCPAIELVGTAEGVSSARTLIKRTKPDLIFLDINMKDGSVLSGMLLKEENKTVTIKVGDKKQVVDRAKIKKMDPPISGMPPMKGLLTGKQIRDLVAYLATLKSDPVKSGSH